MFPTQKYENFRSLARDNLWATNVLFKVRDVYCNRLTNPFLVLLSDNFCAKHPPPPTPTALMIPHEFLIKCYVHTIDYLPTIELCKLDNFLPSIVICIQTFLKQIVTYEMKSSVPKPDKSTFDEN